MRNIFEEERKKIAIPVEEGYLITNCNSVVHCTVQGKNALVHLQDGRMLPLNRPLKVLEELLPAATFIRVHQSHLVNLDHVQFWLAGKKNVLCLSDGSRVRVARTYRKQLMERLQLLR